MKSKRLLAASYGLFTHFIFLVAVTEMFFSLHNGLGAGKGYFTGGRYLWNLLLLVQFPLIHSFLLTPSGRKLLGLRGKSKTAGQLVTTTFVLTASLQLIAVFTFWKPTGVMIWDPPHYLKIVMEVGFLSAWLFLGKSMWDGDITLQTGLKGWFAVFRGNKPFFPPFPRQGVYRFCRQPIYLSYLLILGMSPHITLDRLTIAVMWGSYCIAGALMKERRFLKYFGEEFQRYREQVPFMLPTPSQLFRIKRAEQAI